MPDKSIHSFNIIRYRGRPNFAKIEVKNRYGKEEVLEITRREWMLDSRTNQIVPCAPYDDHFLFELPNRVPGPRFQCTCGSMAGWVGSNVYAHDASPQGALFVCLHHAEYGVHSGGQSRWV